MTRLLFILLFLSACAVQAASIRITATVVVSTNAPLGNTNTITINSSTRTFTNSVTASPATLILETNSMPWTATNILNHLTDYKVSPAHVLFQSTSTNVSMRGAVDELLTVTLAGGWGHVTYTTQTVTTPTFMVRVPLTVEAATNRTTIASYLALGISDYSTTAFATNSVAISNTLIKGPSPLQIIQSPLRLDGRTAVSSNFFATNGFTSALTNINPVSSNAVNYGNALRSEGSGGNSLQVGSNALALGAFSIAVGNSSVATNDNTMAIGTGALATNEYAMAVGNLAFAYGTDSLAMGRNAIALTNNAQAIGNAALANGFASIAVGPATEALDQFSIAIGSGSAAAAGNSYRGAAIGDSASVTALYGWAIGPGSAATHSNSMAIGTRDFGGTSPATTETNQLKLGTATTTVSVPGVVAISGTQTNTTFRGTNVLNGRVDFTSRAYTGMVNGNNGPITLGTNTYVRLSGATTIGVLCSFEAEQDGSYHIVKLTGAITNTIANESGFDGTVTRRIITGTGGDVSFTNNPCILQFIYDATLGRWQLMGLHR